MIRAKSTSTEIPLGRTLSPSFKSLECRYLCLNYLQVQWIKRNKHTQDVNHRFYFSSLFHEMNHLLPACLWLHGKSRLLFRCRWLPCKCFCWNRCASTSTTFWYFVWSCVQFLNGTHVQFLKAKRINWVTTRDGYNGWWKNGLIHSQLLLRTQKVEKESFQN